MRISAPSNTIGGTTAGARNVISGNDGDGVQIVSAMGNVIQGNFIGTDAPGNAPVPNNGMGVRLIISDSNSTIRGNVISGNRSNGVCLCDNGPTGSVVEGNLIGTDVNGDTAIPNGTALPLGTAGVNVFSPNNTIGGPTTAQRNIISGNSGRGIFLIGGTTGNLVQGNEFLALPE